MRIVRTVLLGVTLGSLFILTIAHFSGVFMRPQIADPIVAKPQDEPPPPLTLTIIHSMQDKQTLLSCDNEQCQSIQEGQRSGSALSDGSHWYYYDVNTDNDMLQLIKEDVFSSDKAVITEQTQLTKPRGLYISPDSQKIAYWLDSTSDDTNDLTELWTFNQQEGGTKVIAEKVTREAVITSPRWNRASSHLWFIGDSSASGDPPRHELLISSINPPGLTAAFQQADIKQIQQSNPSTIDIDRRGTKLAYASSGLFGHRISMLDENGETITSSTKGEVVYLEWLPDGRLLYASQIGDVTRLWQINSFTHRLIQTIPGTLQSVVTSPDGQFATMLTRQIGGARLVTIDTGTSRTREQGIITQTGGVLAIATVKPALLEDQPSDHHTSLDDGQLVAFIENNIDSIVGDRDAAPIRILVTDQPNTVFLDYASEDKTHRILLSVQDAVYNDWSIHARYEDRGGDWIKIIGGGLSEPTPVRLYEWEEALEQWILKQDLDS